MPNTPPTLASATLNKTAYAPGEQMILTVVGSDVDEQTMEVTVMVKNKASGATSTSQVVTATVDEIEAVATDSGARTWVATGRVGNTFTLTATA